jgi:c-di-GMP-binding flagellar brake protein YcgR
MRLPIRVLQPISLRRVVDPEDHWYPSVIMGFTDNDVLMVSPIMGPTGEVPVGAGDSLEVEVILPDGLRRFRTLVRRRDEFPVPQLVIEWPGDATRIQRRDAVRVKVEFRVEVTPGTAPGKPIVGVTEDLSEGGMRLDLPQLPVGTALELAFELPGGGGVRHCDAKLLRWGEQQAGQENTRYWLAIQFTEMSDATRRAITRAVFDIQREHLRTHLP